MRIIIMHGRLSQYPKSTNISIRLSKFLMIAVAARTLLRTIQTPRVVLASVVTQDVSSTREVHTKGGEDSSASCTSSIGQSNTYQRIQVQIVHRHGDRSPITPMKDEAYWQSILVEEKTKQKIAENTHLIQTDTANTHPAGGRGPFGKLSRLGLLQMVEVGSSLRERLVGENDKPIDEGNGRLLWPHIFSPTKPLDPDNLRVISTNFHRTIQSVQGLLVGLFSPDGIPSGKEITIDVTKTEFMIPDPKPRRTKEQMVLEERLAKRPHILEKENDMRPLALRVTKALHPLLAEDAKEANFGLVEHPSAVSIETEPLSWNQLAEITKCLQVRNLLPPSITDSDVEYIAEHTAWRWFQSFQNPRLVHLAMSVMTNEMVDYLTNWRNEPPMTIWSAHDSTLIALLCAFRLERPSVWPEYASYLMLELLQKNENQAMYVRFSLNGEVLMSQISGDLVEMMPLDKLADKIRSQEEETASMS